MAVSEKQLGSCVVALLCLYLAMVSCRDEDGIREGYGHIVANVEYHSRYIVYGTDDFVDFDLASFIPDAVFRISTSDGGYSHDWVGGFPEEEAFLPGGYRLEVSVGSMTSEGVLSPFLKGEADFSLEEGETEEVTIEVHPGNVMLLIEVNDVLENYFPEYSLIIHSEGGQYIYVHPNSDAPVFVMARDIDVMLEVSRDTGEKAVVKLTEIGNVKPGDCCRIEVNAIYGADGYPIVETSYIPNSTGDDRRVVFQPSMFEERAGIECIGFVSGDSFIISEGVIPVNPLAMEIDNVGLKNLLLSANWIDKEVDLLDEGLTSLGLQGVKFERGERIRVDFTDMVSSLRASESENFILSLQAVYLDGTMSVPSVLDIKIVGADVEVLSAEPVMSGVNIGKIIVTGPADGEDNLSVELLNSSGRWNEAEGVSVLPTEGGYELVFETEQSESSVFARVLYCGEIKATVELKRIWPSFGIEVDAFATRAVIKVVPEDESLLRYVTGTASIYANGEKLTTLTSDSERGLITVVGLQPQSTYVIKAALPVAPTPADYTAGVSVKTESEEPLPNGDFEDVKSSIRYENMPSGGRYSQNITPIFNQQNFTSYDVYMPMEWTSVNAKTFCTAATNRNTWYMQPSTMIDRTDTYSGARSVKIIDTAWDVTGQDIPDYLQTGLPYTKYSLIVPEIKYRAAGKLFLGSYSFNPINLTEVYQEGIRFGSRPSSLNGFYKFIPGGASSDNYGYVKVEILGLMDNEEKIIAEGEIFLHPVTGFTAFNVPLSYRFFGIKASRVKVMFASSTFVGDIDYETAHVSTTPDPTSSTSTGNTLWIDAASFSY